MRYKPLLCSLALAAAATSSGCGAGNPKREAGELYFSAVPRIGIEFGFSDIKLGKKAQTTSVHPDDGGPSMGEATARIHSVFSPYLSGGLEGSLGTDSLRAKIGIDARINPAHFDNGYRQGHYEVKLQTLGSPYESYAYTRFRPGPVSYIPFVGIEKKLPSLSENLSMVAELGAPYHKDEIERGYDRWGKWEEAEINSCEGFGASAGLGLKFCFRDRGDMIVPSGSVFLRYETSRPSFAGEGGRINSFFVSFLFGVEF